MELNDILTKHSIEPKMVLVLRHRPTERDLNKHIAWLASEKPEVFNAYQSTQTPRVEASMKKAKYVASFLGHQPGKALFVGLFEKTGSAPMTDAEFAALPAAKELIEFGHLPDERHNFLWFDLIKLPAMSEWSGKLVVKWPGKEIGWNRWADANTFAVESISEETQLVAPLLDWRSMTFTPEQLRRLPTVWQARLADWRGIYFIYDRALGQGYVGSAYNEENLWGRWTTHVRLGGDAKKLKACDPSNFVFSILERTSPDMAPKEVIALETTWKERLHTITHGLNDN